MVTRQHPGLNAVADTPLPGVKTQRKAPAFAAPSNTLTPYKRYFGSLPEARLLSPADFAELGAAFRFNTWDSEAESDIPVGYTYLCQFVFHDLTDMVAVAGREPLNQRSASLDLDSVFGSAPADRSKPATPLAIGKTAPSNCPCDLPRDSGGKAMIADLRNDDNLPLAQTHMAVLRFYNAILARLPDLSEADARRLAVTHFQSVVLHDLLPRLIDPVVYEDVMQNGRAVIHIERHKSGEFLIPLEFAAACGRFGHSMIRTVYQNWNSATSGAMLYGFWKNTFNSSDPPLDGAHDQPRTHLIDRWVAQWERLLSCRPSPSGHPPLLASRIDTVFAYPLADIPEVALPELASSSLLPSTNIATLSLLRGLSLQLNSGQAVAGQVLAAVVDRGGPTFPILTPEEIVQDEPDPGRNLLTRPRNGVETLAESTPLLLYTLKEAAVLRNGMRLGPMGSRIVLETVHAAIESAPQSILSTRWKPNADLKPTAGDRYTFADLISFAGLSNP